MKYTAFCGKQSRSYAACLKNSLYFRVAYTHTHIYINQFIGIFCYMASRLATEVYKMLTAKSKII